MKKIQKKFTMNTLNEYGLELSQKSGGHYNHNFLSPEIVKDYKEFIIKSLDGVVIERILAKDFLNTISKTEKTLNMNLFG